MSHEERMAGFADRYPARHPPGISTGARRAIVVLFLVNTTLTVLGTAFAVHAGQKAARTDTAQLALCRSANEARASEVNLWEFLISISKPPETAHDREVLAKFETHLHTVFAPRDCARLGRPQQGG